MRRAGAGPFTVVSFHAHPDDEALLTAGTLARAVADGHRVVLVVATLGEAGLTASAHRPPDRPLGETRAAELSRSAAAIGAHRVVFLGYADSGYADSEYVGTGTPPTPGPRAPIAFSRADPHEAATALARILLEEHADVLTSYDAAGGYGHPDHVQVHRVGRLAAEMAGTAVVLEATVDRRRLQRAVRWLERLGRLVPLPHLPDLGAAFCEPGQLTHRVDVRPVLAAKRRSMRAHASQATGGPRTLGLLLRLPWPARSAVLGHEWFREVGRTPAQPLLDDIFATLRGQA